MAVNKKTADTGKQLSTVVIAVFSNKKEEICWCFHTFSSLSEVYQLLYKKEQDNQ
jgi:hypothetical protein